MRKFDWFYHVPFKYHMFRLGVAFHASDSNLHDLHRSLALLEHYLGNVSRLQEDLACWKR